MDIVAIIAAILSGTAGAFVAAWLARLLLPGEQRVNNLGLIVIGSLAGFVTGIVVGLFDLGPDDGISWWSVGISVVVSMIAIFFLDRWKSDKIEKLMGPLANPSKAGVAGGGPGDKRDRGTAKGASGRASGAPGGSGTGAAASQPPQPNTKQQGGRSDEKKNPLNQNGPSNRPGR